MLGLEHKYGHDEWSQVLSNDHPEEEAGIILLENGALYQLWRGIACHNHTFLPLFKRSGLRTVQGELDSWFLLLKFLSKVVFSLLKWITSALTYDPFFVIYSGFFLVYTVLYTVVTFQPPEELGWQLSFRNIMNIILKWGPTAHHLWFHSTSSPKSVKVFFFFFAIFKRRRNEAKCHACLKSTSHPQSICQAWAFEASSPSAPSS